MNFEAISQFFAGLDYWEVFVQGISYLASLLVFLSLFMKTIVALRVFSIASNVFFILFVAFNGDPLSVMILHMILLPLNILRLYQITQLIRKVKDAAENDASLDPLIPYMQKQHFTKGDVLFRKGDEAKTLYYIQSGTVDLVELKKLVGSPEVIGEIGVFSPFKERTATAVCHEDMEAYTIDEEHIRQIFFQNPKFGYQLTQLIIKRLITNYVHHHNTDGHCLEVEEDEGQG